MAEHLFLTTDEEEAAITAHRLLHAPDVETNDAYINGTVRANILGPAVTAYVEKQVHVVADAFRVATPEARAAAVAALTQR